MLSHAGQGPRLRESLEPAAVSLCRRLAGVRYYCVSAQLSVQVYPECALEIQCHLEHSLDGDAQLLTNLQST